MNTIGKEIYPFRFCDSFLTLFEVFASCSSPTKYPREKSTDQQHTRPSGGQSNDAADSWRFSKRKKPLNVQLAFHCFLFVVSFSSFLQFLLRRRRNLRDLETELTSMRGYDKMLPSPEAPHFPKTSLCQGKGT